ncbi:MAG: glycosyltransferase [Proteobacteria bacterium]|nr:glycosyltransferase [Pseudomonadota bacterium]
MKTVLLFTSAFPYQGGEQFLEEEIKYWKGLGAVKLVVSPHTESGSRRCVPNDVEVRPARRYGSMARCAFGVRGLFSALLWKELLYLRRHRMLGIATILAAWREVSMTFLGRWRIASLVRSCGDDCTIYTYWNDTTAYAACLLKDVGLAKNVISRIHGGDLYEYRRPRSYMPLKRRFVNSFTKIYTISAEGSEYLIRTYKCQEERIEVSRLGVEIPNSLCQRSPEGCLSILSVSNCIRVKRIERILAGVEKFARSNHDINVVWHHIGNGELLDSLIESAAAVASKIKNFTCQFHGSMPNREVKNFYNDYSIDVFINTSESEGVPVSIMEAMAAGVAVIAPRVGGIPHLLEKGGVLISPNCDPDEIADGIRILASSGGRHFSAAANEQIQAKYDAAKNYPEFVQRITSI